MSEWHGADILITEKGVSINGVDLSDCVEAGSVRVIHPGEGMGIPSLRLTILADRITVERSGSGRE